MKTRSLSILTAALVLAGCSTYEDPASDWPRPEGAAPAGRSSPVVIPHPGRNHVGSDTPMEVYPPGEDPSGHE